jgi:hypothetical protein
MGSEEQENRKEITVENLLALKRAERPDNEFWESFDSELKAKTLQTLVKRESWGVRLYHRVAQRTAPIAAVGTAAVLALSFLVRMPAFSSLAGDNTSDESIPTSLGEASAPPFGESFAEAASSDLVQQTAVKQLVAQATVPYASTHAMEEGYAVPNSSSEFGNADFSADVVAVYQSKPGTFQRDLGVNAFSTHETSSDAFSIDSAESRANPFGGRY